LTKEERIDSLLLGASRPTIRASRENRTENAINPLFSIIDKATDSSRYAPFAKPKTSRYKTGKKREPSEEIDLPDTMLSSLVELLEEKGVLTQEECEKRIIEKVKIK
jgi:hypothetical protein